MRSAQYTNAQMRQIHTCEQIFQHISVKALDIFIDPVRMWHSIAQHSTAERVVRANKMEQFSIFQFRNEA